MADTVVSLMIGVSFSFLMTLCTFVIGLGKVNGTVRQLVIAGGCGLYLCQAIANVSVGYIHAEAHLPVGVLSELWWGADPINLRRWYAILFSLIINFATLVCWVALSLHLRGEQEEQAQETAKARQTAAYEAENAQLRAQVEKLVARLSSPPPPAPAPEPVKPPEPVTISPTLGETTGAYWDEPTPATNSHGSATAVG